MSLTLDYLICKNCATQYPTVGPKENCPMCDDPRHFVPPEGTTFTTLAKMRSSGFKNMIEPVPNNPFAYTIETSPFAGIGQRCFLLKTKKGNILWDCIAYLDEPTIAKIKELGGIDAMVISHPHYYSTTALWAETFDCKCYVSALDEEWLDACVRSDRHVLFKDVSEIPLKDYGIEVVVTGGHFPGSAVLWHENRLYVADTLRVTPSGLYFKNRPANTTTYSFLWSYSNQIPLSPEEVATIWNSIRHLEFEDAHGAFPKQDVYGDAKARARESARIVIAFMRGNEGMLLP